MRRVESVLASGMVLGAVAAALLAGCQDRADDCSLNYSCRSGSGSSGTGGGSSSSTGGGGSSTGGGGTGGMPASCVPSDAKGAVDDACGVFVSSSLGDDKNAGTKEKPFKTMGAALSKVGSGRVYACAEAFSEEVTIAAKVDIYGGLDCKSWAYVGPAGKTTLTAAADAVPLTVASTAGGTEIVDVAVVAANAMKDGGSSIAVVVDQAGVTFTRCDLTAGDGVKGKDGDPGDSNGMSAAAGVPGNNGADACNGDVLMGNPGGTAVGNMCEGMNIVSVGGAGGKGSVASGTAGDIGQTGALGAGGVGEPSMGAWSCGANGTGQGGDNGKPGNPGPAGTALGMLSSSGYAGDPGQSGTPGAPGQGGGGGGGAKGGMICPANGAGASGGSGGAGGCGGKPGQGGAAGGASIALVSLSASVTLTDCTLHAGKGADGGKGGDPQPGGGGGAPGVGGKKVGLSNNACSGGQGGQGGNGGPGGGGRGGHSIAVAYTGTAVAKMGKTSLMLGAQGKGGLGGNMGMSNAGTDGASVAEQVFP
jgi:hypothetical protein